MRFPLKIAACVLWSLQLILAIIVLGLSADRVKNQVFDDAPTTIKYSIFTGAFGMIVCVVGIVAVFLEIIPLIGVLAGDALSGIFFLAGGIAYSIGLKGVDCNAGSNDIFNAMANSDLVNLGTIQVDGQTYYGISTFSTVDQLRDVCRRAIADETIQYLAFLFCLFTMAVMFLERRRSSGGAIV